ncbi:MAG TPA: peptidoglycan-binding domain-containing protein, partial [Casimicrobiaceae bacterium]|nr:peptidoglycan-binding domain-containing protein [Casimicrobiaceae bacterium]
SISNMPRPDIHDRSFVRSVQQALIEDGYNAGPIDGIIGPRTSGALREFQDANGLPATGRIDSATVAALGIAPPNESAISANVAPYRSASTR